ncbi:hypothetical protein DRN74_03830 [Candidatus Micrarchaeota archaeon]|nr:MAG: hypothetical protein DRN74_03830 [Candidatus Micrarchaeota archaeon]
MISKVFGAIGWGDIMIKKEGGTMEALINYFPWTPYSSNSVIFRGLLSGAISYLEDRRVLLSLKGKNLNKGYLAIRLEEGKT